jgi:hypothetical protein
LLKKGENKMYNILDDNGNTINDKPIKTKKEAKEFLKEIYLEDHVPFFELGCRGKLDGFSFKEFLIDFTITKKEK